MDRAPQIDLVRWQDLLPAQRDDVCSLRISGEQVEFAGTVEQAIAVVESDAAGEVAGLAITMSSAVVGFLVLRRRGALGGWAPPDAAAVTAMRVDVGHQGRGVGSGALEALAVWVATHWRACTSIALQVDEANHIGRRAYGRGGFVVTGPPVAGRIGPVLTMVRPLDGAPG